MRAFMVIALLLAVGIGVTGFARGWFSFSTSSDEEKKGLTGTVDLEKAQKDRDAVLGLFLTAKSSRDQKTARDDYQQQAETRLKAMALNLDELMAKAKNGRAVTKEKMNEAVADLNKKTEAGREVLRELQTTTPERWEALKTHLNTSLDELETGFENTFARFMNEWTHSGRERINFFWHGVCS